MKLHLYSAIKVADAGALGYFESIVAAVKKMDLNDFS